MTLLDQRVHAEADPNILGTAPQQAYILGSDGVRRWSNPLTFRENATPRYTKTSA